MDERCCRCVYRGFCFGDSSNGCCITIEDINRNTQEDAKEQMYETLGWHKDSEWYKDPQ